MSEKEYQQLMRAVLYFKRGDEKGWTKGMDILISLINVHKKRKFKK